MERCQPLVQKTIIELEEYRCTLEESRNAFIHFEQSQETLSRFMAEMLDKIHKRHNGEQTSAELPLNALSYHYIGE